MTPRALLPIAAAAAAALPGITLRLTGTHPPALLAAAVFGMAVVGAAFLLAWGAEVLQLDLSAGLALALLALIAVLPEYAVDFVFAWKAGDDPDAFAPLALANMSGGNQMLIGVGWPLVVLLAAWRLRRLAGGRDAAGVVEITSSPTDVAVAEVARGRTWREVRLGRSHSIEIAFLALATLYGLTLPFRSTLTILDALVLVAMYGAYLARTARLPAGDPHLIGPAAAIASFQQRTRRLVVAAMMCGAAATIVLCAERFAEALVDTGEELGVSTFLLVKWVAPLASEAPELLVAALFAWRLNTDDALGALVSSKVSQWTLLVGTLPIVFAVSSGTLHGLPLGIQQQNELFVTAAQSALAVAVLANRGITVREAVMLLGLFVAQFVAGIAAPASMRDDVRLAVGVVYLTLAVWTLVRNRRDMRDVLHDGIRLPIDDLVRD